MEELLDIIDNLVTYCKRYKIKKVGIIYCCFVQKEMRPIVGYIEKFFQIETCCCDLCAVSSENNDLDHESRFLDSGMFLMINLCDYQRNMFLSRCKKLSVSIWINKK